MTHSKERLPHEWCTDANDTRMTLTYELQPVWAVVVSDDDKQVLQLPGPRHWRKHAFYPHVSHVLHTPIRIIAALISSFADNAHASLRHVGVRVPGSRSRAHHDSLEVADKGKDEAEIARDGDGDNEGGLGRQGRPRDAAEDVGQRRGEGANLSPLKWGRGEARIQSCEMKWPYR